MVGRISPGCLPSNDSVSTAWLLANEVMTAHSRSSRIASRFLIVADMSDALFNFAQYPSPAGCLKLDTAIEWRNDLTRSP